MLDLMQHHRWYLRQAQTDPAAGAALGRMSLGLIERGAQPIRSADGRWSIVSDGELYDAPQVRTGLQSRGVPLAGDCHAALLLAGYLHGGTSFLRQLHGSFVAAIWDRAEQKLVLINDRFGLRPLYVAHAAGRLIFASSLRAVLLDEAIPGNPNWRGIAQFFSFGQYLCHDTSIEAVDVLPAASHCVFDARQDGWSVDSYYELAQTPQGGVPQGEALLDRVDTLFSAAVKRRLQGTGGLGLALSGGLDARTILGVVDHDWHALQSVSYGIPGSLDHRCAERMAEIVGCRHTSHMLDAGFLEDFPRHLANMVRLTDGQYLSQCIILPTLPIYRKLGIDALMRGHAGELLHMYKAYAYSLDQRALDISSDAQLEDHLMRRLQGYMLSGVSGPIFRQLDLDQVRELALESLREQMRPFATVVPPVQRIWHLFVCGRLRRETTLSLAKFNSVAEIRTPYLDNDLIELLLAIEPEMKLGEKLQEHILSKRRPEFLQIVNANTGTRIGAGPLARKLSTLRMRVLAKLGVPGYQPYERLGLWLRRELAPLVENILLSDECLSRGIFVPETVRRIVSEHTSRRQNHTYLLMAMMIFELGQRQFAGTETHELPPLKRSREIS